MAKKVVKSKSVIPENESKADRFKRVVSPRVMKAVKAIRTIGFCTGASYEHQPAQIQQIVDRLVNELKDMEAKFTSKGEGKQGFEFDE